MTADMPRSFHSVVRERRRASAPVSGFLAGCRREKKCVEEEKARYSHLEASLVAACAVESSTPRAQEVELSTPHSGRVRG